MYEPVTRRLDAPRFHQKSCDRFSTRAAPTLRGRDRPTRIRGGPIYWWLNRRWNGNSELGSILERMRVPSRRLN